MAEEEVRGLVVVSQSCDIVRAAAQRPFVEVSPLVEVDESDLVLIRQGKRPAYAHLPLLEERNLVADLDRTMTVSKAVLSRWQRTPGTQTDEEIRAFAEALARKRSRFAFPDDFTSFVGRFADRLKAKHNRDSDEGAALRSLAEIRVAAADNWDAAEVRLTFWLIKRPEQAINVGAWARQIEAWRPLVTPLGRFVAAELALVSLDDMTATDYLGSDRLDLDHLSNAGR